MITNTLRGKTAKREIRREEKLTIIVTKDDKELLDWHIAEVTGLGC
ncbi:MAG: hypothetical protein GSR72_00945 [Desulfurococcales archaeon]|nr:hypothetical protein [Desulfurococcales archaeon]